MSAPKIKAVTAEGLHDFAHCLSELVEGGYSILALYRPADSPGGHWSALLEKREKAPGFDQFMEGLSQDKT